MIRRLVVPFVALGLVIGCGGDEVSPEAAVAEAATKTADAGTSRMEFSATIEPPAAVSSEELEFGGSGVFDYKARRGRLEYDLSGLLEAAGQETGNAEAELLFDEFVLYMRFPLLAQSLPDGKEWVKIDLQKIGEQQGFDLGQLSQLTQSDPSQFLNYLRAASKDVAEVGEKEVRGVATTHYRAKIDLEKVADQAPAESREQVRASIDALIRQTGMRTMPVEVWIDEDGLLRRERLEMTFDVPGGASGIEQEAAMTMTMDFFDFGVEVDVEPPPADQVTDITELAAQGS